MTPQAAGHQQLLKDINRMALVRLLCLRPGLSRADLANEARLTKSTITLLVRDLIAEGWLQEREVLVTGDPGRRPTPLFINPSRLLLLGAEVGVEGLRAVATTLTGHVLARVVAPYGARRTLKARLQGLADALCRLVGELKADVHRVIGIGIGVPGGVDELAGVLHFAPNLGWRNVPLRALLAELLADGPLARVPLFVQNEADVAALGELEFNPVGDADPLLYLSLNQGVGAGVIVGDRLLTGSRGFAGEVGHIVLQIDGPACSCGRQGCAEALIGPRSMLREADVAESLAEPLAEVRLRLARGDAATERAVQCSGRYLGVLLQNLAAAYDPECIVLGGSVVELGPAFVEPALQALHAYAQAAGLEPPTVRTSHFGADAVAVGAAALVRYCTTRPLHSVEVRGLTELAEE